MDKNLHWMWKFYFGVGILGMLSYGALKAYKLTKDSYSEFYRKNLLVSIDKMKNLNYWSIVMSQMLKNRLFPKEEIDS